MLVAGGGGGIVGGGGDEEIGAAEDPFSSGCAGDVEGTPVSVLL